MNVFLEAAKKHNNIASKIDLEDCNEVTSVLESKLPLANKFNKHVKLELINYAETLNDESRIDELVGLLQNMNEVYYANFSSMMSVLKGIPTHMLLEDELKKFVLDKDKMNSDFYSLIINNSSHSLYNKRNEQVRFYKYDIQVILARVFYSLYLKNSGIPNYSLLITPHPINYKNDYNRMFLFYKHFSKIIHDYFNSEFELTTDDADVVFKEKLEKLKKLIAINNKTSLELNDLSLIYKKMDELNINFDLIFKLVNQYLYAKKLGNHKLFIEVIEANVNLIDDYEGSYDDYLMTYELINTGVELDKINSKRYKELREHFISKNIYNHLYKDKFVYYLSNDEEIQLNISEQMAQLNKIVKSLKGKELKEKNTDNKNKISEIVLMISNLTLKKSKVFLRLLSERIEDFNVYDSILFNPVIFENLQLNMLNEKTMDLYLSTSDFSYKKSLESMEFESKLAPEFLYEVIQSTFKYKLSKLLVDKGIKNDIIIRILKSFSTILEGSTVIKESDYLNLIAEMPTKEINELYKATTSKKEISKENVFSLYLLEKMYSIFKQVENDNQLRFILRNDDNIQDNLNDMLEKELSSKKEYKTFQSKLDASDAFFEKHKSSLLNFFYDDKHRLALTYAKDSSPQQVNNVFLLAKADIAGMLHTVKFSKIEQELEMALPNESKDLWKKQLSIDFDNRFSAKEVVDFRTLMELGENPTRSCMNYASGQYRRCLLSIFDSTKQYVGVYDNGKLVARAILRLTKTTKTQNSSVLGFEDVENLSEETAFEDKTKNEEPVLFLERMYTNYNSNQRIQMQNQIIKLVKKKAEEMGIKAIAASDYNCKEGKEPMKIFITHSQNGNQYLDSFGGQATENSGGVYKTANNYGIIHEI